MSDTTAALIAVLLLSAAAAARLSERRPFAPESVRRAVAAAGGATARNGIAELRDDEITLDRRGTSTAGAGFVDARSWQVATGEPSASWRRDRDLVLLPLGVE